MAYENLKNAIKQAIKNNNSQEITGDLLQSTLLNIVNTINTAEEAIIFDVSVYNNGAVFESLQALLSSSNLSTLIPTSVRRGGMTVRFIKGSKQDSDNKYVQYRLMATSFSTDEANWQGVDDEPTAGSDNLVKSEGVYGIVEYVGGMGEQASYVDINSGYYGKGVKLQTCPIGSTFNETSIEKAFAQALAKVDVTGKNFLIIDGIRNSVDNFYSWFVLDGSNNILDGSNRPLSSDPTKLVIDLTNYTNAVLAYVSYQYNKDIHIYYSENEPIAEKVKNMHTIEEKVSNLESDTSNIHRLIGPASTEIAKHTVVGTLSYNGIGLKVADNKVGDLFNESTSFDLCLAQGIEKINVQGKKAVIIQGIRNSTDNMYSWFVVNSENIIIAVGKKTYPDPSYVSIDLSSYIDSALYLYVSRMYNSSGDIQAWYSDIVPITDVPKSATTENVISQGSKNVSAGASTWVANVFTVKGINAKKGDILVVETNDYCERIVLCANLNLGMNEKTYITSNNKCTIVLREDLDLLRVGAYVKGSEGVAIAGTIKWKAYIVNSPINVYSKYINNLQESIIENKQAKEYYPSLFDESVFNFGNKYRGEGVGLIDIYENSLAPKFTQSATSYGKYAFMISDGSYSCMNVVDISIGEYLQYINVEEPNVNNHNNTATFSSLKYDQSDEFPLMFCGSIHSYDFHNGLIITAYRIYKDGATWKAKGLYNINLPSEYGEGKNGVACQAIVNDDKIYIIAKMNDNITKIKVLQNPSDVSTDITLTDSDVIDEFEINLGLDVFQDAFIYNGILYQLDNTRLVAIDLSNKILAGTVNMPTSGISEYEGCFVYNEMLYVTTINHDRTLWVLQKVDFQQSNRLSVVSERPIGKYIGQTLYDSTLKKPVYWNGTAWTDALGNELI